MRHIFIINPMAGKEDQEILKKRIQEVYQEEDFQIVYTTKEKHASILAKEYARNCKEVCIYACGGDGTINEVVQGMFDCPNAYLGIIPIGTGNDFIKSLVPYTKEDFLQIENYKEPSFISCDVLQVGNKVAINTASIGLDVAVAKNVNRYKGVPLLKGSMPYYLGLLNSMVSSLSATYTLVIDQEIIKDKEFTFIVGCNGGYYGGGYHPCPEASINDGFIDVCLVHKVTRRKILTLSNKYKKGTHVEDKYKDLVSMYRCKSLQVLADKEIPINLDGEVHMMKNPSIQILEKQITLCLPKLKKNK